MKIILGVFIFISTIWGIFKFEGSNNSILYNIIGFYWVMALIGTISGFISFKKWGIKGAVGKSLLFFTLGIFSQVLGQLSYLYYIDFLHIEIPYPSVGDVFYLLSIPMFITGVVYLARVSGAKYFKNNFLKTLLLSIPVLIIGCSYWLFLKDYEFDYSSLNIMIFDFAFPVGQALYISIALMAYFLCRKYLGGYMKLNVLLLFFALLILYVADFLFTYMAYQGTWQPGGLVDYLFFVAYLLMSVSLQKFSNTYDHFNK